MFSQDEYSILNSKHFIGIHGYIIVYSVASRQSFDMVRVIRDKILNHLASIPSRPCESLLTRYREPTMCRWLLSVIKVTSSLSRGRFHWRRDGRRERILVVPSRRPVLVLTTMLRRPSIWWLGKLRNHRTHRNLQGGTSVPSCDI